MPKFQTDDARGYTVPKKRYRKKKGGKITRSEVKAIAKQVVAAAPEKKNWDVLDSTEAISPTGNGWLVHLTNVPSAATGATGPTDNTRVGNEITISYLGIRGMYIAFQNPEYGHVYNARVLVFQWYGDTSVDAPSIEKILATPNYINGFYRRESAGKYKILYDQRMIMSSHGASDANAHLIDISISGSTKGLRKTIHFNDYAPTGTNHIYLMVLNDTPDAPNPPYFDNLYSRLLFTDM